MALKDQLVKEIQTIDSQIADIKRRADEQVAALRTRRQAAVRAQVALSDAANLALDEVGADLRGHRKD